MDEFLIELHGLMRKYEASVGATLVSYWGFNPWCPQL